MSKSLPFQTLVRSRPDVSVLSPRTLNAKDFLPRKSRGCKTANAFMIYRTVYGKILSKGGFPSKMTEVSRWASEAWKYEREELKNEYKEFAKKVRDMYRERTQVIGIPRAIRPTHPIMTSEPQIVSNVDESSLNMLDLTTFCEPPPYPSIRHNINNIYLPRVECDFEFDSFIEGNMQELPIPATTSSYNYLWQNIYDGNIGDIDIFDNSSNQYNYLFLC